MIYTLTLNPALDKEYTVSQIQFNEVLRTSRMRVDFGGKGFNVSRMLAVLGVPSTAVGLVGGASGMQLREGLEAAGIPTDFVQVRGETRTNVSIIEEGLSRYIKINETGPIISPGELDALMAIIRNHASAGDCWVLSGSLPPGVPADMYAKIIHLVQSNGARAVLDSSGEPLRLGCLASPYLVKPNISEASQITSLPAETPDQILRLVKQFHGMGVKIIVISAGKNGAYCSDGKSMYFGQSPRITEKNPIGAGDAMLAGALWSLGKEEMLSEALRWGLACGAAAANMEGTGVPPKQIVQALYSKIHVKTILR